MPRRLEWRFLKGQLVEVGPEIDPDNDWNRLKGLAIVLDPKPNDLSGMVEVRYVKPRGLPEEQLPQQRIIGMNLCRSVR